MPYHKPHPTGKVDHALAARVEATFATEITPDVSLVIQPKIYVLPTLSIDGFSTTLKFYAECLALTPQRTQTVFLTRSDTIFAGRHACGSVHGVPIFSEGCQFHDV